MLKFIKGFNDEQTGYLKFDLSYYSKNEDIFKPLDNKKLRSTKNVILCNDNKLTCTNFDFYPISNVNTKKGFINTGEFTSDQPTIFKFNYFKRANVTHGARGLHDYKEVEFYIRLRKEAALQTIKTPLGVTTKLPNVVNFSITGLFDMLYYEDMIRDEIIPQFHLPITKKLLSSPINVQSVFTIEQHTPEKKPFNKKTSSRVFADGKMQQISIFKKKRRIII